MARLKSLAAYAAARPQAGTDWNGSYNGYHAQLALATALPGSTPSLHTNAFDEALGLPTDFSACPQLADHHREESELCPHTVDPLAGSCYVESLTDQIVKQPELLSSRSTKPVAWRKRSTDLPANDLKDAARDVLIGQGKRVIVGVNKYKRITKTKPMLEIDNVMVHNGKLLRWNAFAPPIDDAAVTAALNA